MDDDIIGQMQALVTDYEKDEQIETKILEDLKDAIELELYERQTLLSSIADSIEDEFSGE